MQLNTSMMKYEGYVLYSNDNGKALPIGVISHDNEQHAISTSIPGSMKKFLIEIEDRRFFNHNGVDPLGIIRAITANFEAHRIVQGGSTITQQLARNLLRNNSKTFSRKFKETVRAVSIERSYQKKEILDMYFNNIYFGKNLFGLRSASLHYFCKEPQYLSNREQLALITLLRGPNYYASNPIAMKKRFTAINDVLHQRGALGRKQYRTNRTYCPIVGHHQMQVFQEKGVELISTAISAKAKTISTTINFRIQTTISDYVYKSKYPVSIICLSSKGVLGVASSYGTSHPFAFKSNIGSTLKPFLYSFLRESGISCEQSFPANMNSLGWPIREVITDHDYLSLRDALFYSNNNVFVNACNKIGIDKALDFLATLLNIERQRIHPSAILGAIDGGLSLYDLALTYIKFFYGQHLSSGKIECLEILFRSSSAKIDISANGIFLKTGTTNSNMQRFAILGNPDKVFAISRHENVRDDYSKDGSFVKSLTHYIGKWFPKHGGYTWI